MQTLTSSSFVSGYSTCYSGSRSIYYKSDFVKTGASNDITIKFPAVSAYSFSSNCNLNKTNNATYVISNLTTATRTTSYCLSGATVTKTDTGATNLNAKLTIDGKEVMTYSLTSSGGFSTNVGLPTNMVAVMTIGIYEYNVNFNSSTNSLTYSVIWKKNGQAISGNVLNLEGAPIANLNNNNCSTSTNSSASPYSPFTKYSVEVTRSNIKISGQVNPKDYITELKSKYGNPDANGFYDSTSYKRIYSDTLLTDKYYGFAVYQTSTGAKIGDLKLRYKESKLYYSIYPFITRSTAWYIYYTDGTRELLSNRLVGYSIYYLPSFVYLKY